MLDKAEWSQPVSSKEPRTMLMEQLFSSGIMKMGPSRVDPQRQVGVFNLDFVSGLPALRAAQMEKIRWLVGEWNYENKVPATSVSQPYSDIGSSRFSLREKTNWICMVAPDAEETPHITFDPFSRQWIYLLMKGAFGILRSSEGWVGSRIVFTGLMTMIGINCDWRITLTLEGADRFSLVNEERNQDGSWAYIDAWHFNRKG
jgi:hypothetical protein